MERQRDRRGIDCRPDAGNADRLGLLLLGMKVFSAGLMMPAALRSNGSLMCRIEDATTASTTATRSGGRMTEISGSGRR